MPNFLACQGLKSFLILFFSAFANASFSIYNMPLSDIADKDTERYNRE